MKFIVAVVMLAVALGAEAYSATSYLNGPHLGVHGYNGGFYGGYPGYYQGYGASGYYGSSGHYAGYGAGYGAHYGLPSAVAVHSAPVFGSHSVHTPLAYASYGSHAVHAPAVSASHGSHAVHASTALATVGTHGSTYVAKTRGAEHVAPLPGHVHSVASVNVHPAPGTW